MDASQHHRNAVFCWCVHWDNMVYLHQCHQCIEIDGWWCYMVGAGRNQCANCSGKCHGKHCQERFNLCWYELSDRHVNHHRRHHLDNDNGIAASMLCADIQRHTLHCRARKYNKRGIQINGWCQLGNGGNTSPYERHLFKLWRFGIKWLWNSHCWQIRWKCVLLQHRPWRNVVFWLKPSNHAKRWLLDWLRFFPASQR